MKAITVAEALAPRLETERLILRAHKLDDFEDYVAMWGDPEMTRHIGGKPRPRDEAWFAFLRYAGLWAHLGFGYWAVEDRETGRYAGDVGVADFKRPIEPSFGETPEMGWTIAPAFQGRGYASEAGAAVTNWADETLGAPRLVCMIAPENATSFRIAEKLGFSEYARTEFKGSPTVLLERG